MARDQNQEVVEPIEKEGEAPAHRRRREARQQLRQASRLSLEDLDEDDFEVESFQPLKKKRNGY